MDDSLHSRRTPHFDSAFFILNEDNNKRRANATTKEFGTETMINRKRKHSFCFAIENDFRCRAAGTKQYDRQKKMETSKRKKC